MTGALAGAPSSASEGRDLWARGHALGSAAAQLVRDVGRRGCAGPVCSELGSLEPACQLGSDQGRHRPLQEEGGSLYRASTGRAGKWAFHVEANSKHLMVGPVFRRGSQGLGWASSPWPSVLLFIREGAGVDLGTHWWGSAPPALFPPPRPQPVAESHVGLKAQWRRLWVACNFRRFSRVASPPVPCHSRGDHLPKDHMCGGWARLLFPSPSTPRDRRPGATPPFSVQLGCVLLSPGE